MLAFEKQAKQLGYRLIAGVDEAGRGPLAGPVVAAACIILGALDFPVADSKTLSPKKRAFVYRQLTACPQVLYAVAFVDHQDVDRLNILQASLLAMQRAVAKLPKPADYVLVDGNHLPSFQMPGRAIVKGDSLSESIAAASIIAKEERDLMMLHYDKQWPEYQFAKHKGYPTALHRALLQQHGPSPIHRRSFRW